MKKFIIACAIATLVAPSAHAGWFSKSKPVPARNVRQYSFNHPNNKPKLTYGAYLDKDGNQIKHGAYRIFNLNGSLRETGVYTDGVITQKNTYQWYGSGQKSRETSTFFNKKGEQVGRATVHTWFLNGKPSGDWIYKNGILVQNNTYYPTGSPKEQKRYNDNGLLHGIQQGWYENGAKSFAYNYKDGQKHGPFIQWDQNGTILRNEIWDQDKLIMVNGKKAKISQAHTNFKAATPAKETSKHRRR